MSRIRVIDTITKGAPVPPACFSHNEWIDWLCLAYITGIRLVRRADRGEHRRSQDRKQFRIVRYEVLPTNRIDYCCDCTSNRRSEMIECGKCHPSEVSDPPAIYKPTETHA